MHNPQLSRSSIRYWLRPKLSLMAATALGGLLLPTPVLAQDAPASAAPTAAGAAAATQQEGPSTQLPSTTTQGAPSTPNANASTTAATSPAAAADANADAAGEIVVTAQFRAQNLQQTPLAITAISGDQLLQKGAVNMQDLSNVAPSVSFHHTGSAGGKTLAAFIRGVGASDYNFGIEPGVAFYVDDVYLGPSYGTLLDFIDLERAEVLRGPQGTLSGKNAIGGAVRLVTVKPKGSNTGYIEAEYGSRHLLRFRAAYDVSIVPDSLFMRVSGYSAHQDGLVKLYNFACVNPTLVGNTAAPYGLKNDQTAQSCRRGDLGNTDVRAARVQFRWQPSSNFEVNLSGDYIDDNARGAADVLLSVDPSGFANYRSPIQPAGTPNYFVYYYGVPYDTRFVPTKRYTSYSNFADPVYGLTFPPKNTLLTKDVTLNMDWKIAPDLSLQSITAYRALHGHWAYDSDSSPLATDGVYDSQFHKQFSQELRLSGALLDNRLNFTVGGFYYHAKERDVDTVEANLFNFFIFTDSKPKSTNYAAFVHGEFKLTDTLTAIGGLRESHENKTYLFLEGDIPGTPGTAFLVNGVDGLNFPAKTKYNRFDYRAGLQWQATPTQMIYVSTETGFRGGGFNPRPSNTTTALPFSPEKLTSYEGGVRSEFFNRRVRWNNTVYYSQYRDIQLSGRLTAVTPGGAFPITVTTNAAKAHIYGVESELQADINRYFSLNGAASYTHFKYDDLGVATALSATTGPTLDSMQRYTPKWKFNVGAQATLPVLDDFGKLTLNVDYAYQTKQYPDGHNFEVLKIPAYGVGNARLTFATLEHGWSVSAAVRNMFDKYYFYNRNFISGNFQVKGNPAPPREWSLSLRKTF